MEKQISLSVVESVMIGNDHLHDSRLHCEWLSENRLVVSSRFGIFDRLVTKNNYSQIADNLNEIIFQINKSIMVT